MSDQGSYVVATLGSESITKLRNNAEANVGKSRLKTTVNYSSGPQTLDGTADEVRCDGTFTVNLPPSPTDGDHYEFVQVNAAGTLTIGRNGKTINGAASDVTLSTQWASKRMTWNMTANTWWSR